MKVLAIILLATLGWGQPSTASPFHVRPTLSILRDWKFLASTGASVGATLFDEQATLDGLKRGVCVEQGDNPHPSRGDLAKVDFGILAGLTGLKFVIAKSGAPWPSWIVIDGVAVGKHVHGGMRWMNHC